MLSPTVHRVGCLATTTSSFFAVKVCLLVFSSRRRGRKSEKEQRIERWISSVESTTLTLYKYTLLRTCVYFCFDKTRGSIA